MGQRLYGNADGVFIDLKNGERISLNDAIEIVKKEELGPVKIFERFNCASCAKTEDISALFRASSKYMLLIGQADEIKKYQEKLTAAINEKTAAETKNNGMQEQLTELQKKIQEAEEAAAKAKKATKPKDPKKDPEIKVLIADAISAARAEDAEALNRAQDDLLETQDKLKRADAEIRRLTKALELAEQRAKDAEEAAVVQTPPAATKAPKQEPGPADTSFLDMEISNGVTIGLIRTSKNRAVSSAEEKVLEKFHPEDTILRRPYAKIDGEIIPLDDLDVNKIVKTVRDKAKTESVQFD